VTQEEESRHTEATDVEAQESTDLKKPLVDPQEARQQDFHDTLVGLAEEGSESTSLIKHGSGNKGI
jgi:hypothetical protein